MSEESKGIITHKDVLSQLEHFISSGVFYDTANNIRPAFITRNDDLEFLQIAFTKDDTKKGIVEALFYITLKEKK